MSSDDNRRMEYVMGTRGSMINDMRRLGLSQAELATSIDMAVSTCNAFFTRPQTAHHRTTIEKFLSANCWSTDTRLLLGVLLDWKDYATKGLVSQSPSKFLAMAKMPPTKARKPARASERVKSQHVRPDSRRHAAE